MTIFLSQEGHTVAITGTSLCMGWGKDLTWSKGGDLSCAPHYEPSYLKGVGFLFSFLLLVSVCVCECLHSIYLLVGPVNFQIVQVVSDKGIQPDALCCALNFQVCSGQSWGRTQFNQLLAHPERSVPKHLSWGGNGNLPIFLHTSVISSWKAADRGSQAKL